MFNHDLFIHSTEKHLYFWKAGKWQGKATFSKINFHFKWGATLFEVYKFFIICQCSNLISLSPIVINNDTFRWKGLLCCLQRQPSLPGPEVGISFVLPYSESWPEREEPWTTVWVTMTAKVRKSEPRVCWHGAKELGPRCFCVEFPDFHRNSFVFWLHHRACEILVAQSGTEPGPTAVKALPPNH